MRLKGQCRRWQACWCCLLLILGQHASLAQLSKPVAADKHWADQTDNKFLQRTADNDRDDTQFEEFAANGAKICPLDIELKWMTEVSSSVYATPLITDLYADGRKDIIVPGFVHYTEVLEGPDGAKALGWPGFHRSNVHASPLLYDIDMDGIRDVMVVTYDGEVVFFKDNGEQLLDRLYIPRLRVRKNWYVGLNPDPVDHSHPDIGKAEGAENPFDHAAHAAQAAHKAAAAHATPSHAGHAAAGHAPQHPQSPPPPPQQQQPPVKPASIPTQPLPQGQQHPQQQAGGQAPSLPQSPPPPVVQQQQPPHPPAQQQGTAQQATQQQGTAQQAAATPQAATTQQAASQQPAQEPPKDMSAVLKVKERIDNYAKQFGQEAANKELDTLRHINKPMYDAVTAMIAQSKELEQLAAAAQPQQAQQQAQGQVQPQQQPQHHQRRLMSVEGSSSGDNSNLIEPFALSKDSSGSARHLLQDSHGHVPASAQAVNTPAGTTTGTIGSNTAGGSAPTITGVEADPSHAGLTQEALESFKVFEDVPVDDAAGQGGVADGMPPADAVLGGVQGGDGAGVGAGDEGVKSDGALAQEEHHTKDLDYDELGDSWKDMRKGADAQTVPGGSDTSTTGGTLPSWEDESFVQAAHEQDGGFIYLDAHVLCTPAIADIDGDGQEDLVLAVSYFYDKEYYDDPAHASELQGVDKEKYVAGGIVVYDLRTKLFKWQQHLDLTTTTTKFTAHMFSSPTLVDLDVDGKMEIIVGTSVGFVYVLDHKGNTRTGWPVQMGEVQGQVLVADLNADGNMEMFVGDTLGNVALLDIDGKEIWEKHVKSMLGQGAVAGDIDGDGLLEIVFGTLDGKVHAIRGTDGSPIANFPFQTGYRVQAQPTIAPLDPHNPSVQHILVMSFDGFLYAINGKSGCAHAVDIGENSYSAVLVDDVCGDGNLELLVSTMNGNVYMLQTQAPYHPLKTWSSQVQGVNGLVARWNHLGFVATQTSRQLRDVAGQLLQVQVEVTDQRTLLEHGLPADNPPRGPYNVTVLLKGVGIAEMNSGPQPVIGLSDVLPKPGKAIVQLPCPKTRTTSAVHLDLVTQHKLHYEDEFVVSFHMHFHKLLKWLIALPLLGMALVVLVVGQTVGYGDRKNYHLG